MMKLGKFSTTVVLALVLGLAVCTTGAFAQGENQRVEHENISISAHKTADTMRSVVESVLASAVQRPHNATGNCGNWGWGNNCGFQSHVSLRCASQRECRTVQECRWSRWGRICRGFKICRFRSICRRCFDNGWGGGFFGGSSAWGVKRH